MDNAVSIVVALLAVMLFGFAVLWISNLPGFTSVRPTWRNRAMRAFGWTILVLSMLILIGLMSHVFAIVTVVMAIVIGAMAALQYVQGEQQSLLWMLATSAERGIPLEDAARAFAQERSDSFGSRSILLAEYLEAGVPLALALRRSQILVPEEALIAAELGQKSGTLASALPQSLELRDESSEIAFRNALETATYYAFVLSLILGTFIFVISRPLLILSQMHTEMGTTIPDSTRMIFDFVHEVNSSNMLSLAALFVSLGLVFLGIPAYLGLLPRFFPGVQRVRAPVDTAIILRWLSKSVSSQRPVGGVLRELAACFPTKLMRRRLERASQRIDLGANWPESLALSQVIRHTDAVLFSHAEKTGNLPWALEQMAHSTLRRATYRIRAALAILGPVMLVILGALVLAVTITVFIPMMSLLHAIS